MGFTADDGFLGDDASLESRDEEGSVDTDTIATRTRTGPSMDLGAERRASSATVLKKNADGGITTGLRPPPPPLTRGSSEIRHSEDSADTVERPSSR